MSQIKTKGITDKNVTAAKLGSGAATTGQVVIADGSGGASYSSTPTLSGPVVGTQSSSDNSTKAASTAFVATAITNALAAFQPLEATYAASTTNIVGTYVNGVSGVGATFTVTATGAFSIDGVSPPSGSRVLLKDQSSGFQNGVYDLTTVGTTGISPVLTRSADFNTTTAMNAGDLIPVVNGTANALTSWLQTATITTIGTDSLVFAEYSKNPSSYVSSTLTSAHILVGNGSNVATDVAASGDLTLANTGAFTIANNAVTNTKLAQMVANTVKANNTGSTANASDVTLTANATASSVMSRDTNANTTANSFIEGYTTTASAAGTTTLTVGSTEQQYFTGTTTQTVVLPVVSTLVLGQKFQVVNNSTGVVTVQSSGANTVQAMAASTSAWFTVILVTGTTAASWSTVYIAGSISTPVSVANGGTGDTTLTAHGVLIGNGTSAVSVTGTGTTGQVLTSNGSSADPTFQTASGGSSTAPTVQTFTSGSGTYTRPTSPTPLYLRVRMVGGGGGGGGDGTGSGANGTSGTASTFGTSLLSANGGIRGITGQSSGQGGRQATQIPTINSPAIGTGVPGGSGNSGGTATSSANGLGGTGGCSGILGSGSGEGGGGGGAGGNAATNSGGGGGGAGSNTTTNGVTGGGGGAGASGIDAIIPSPSATYSYTVGTGGTGGAGGVTGGNGAAGYIIVEEHYQ
jgi:hypothetical protein